MAQIEASTKQMSMKMNKAMTKIGVNDDIIEIRRNSFLQIECNDTAIRRCQPPFYEHAFYLGSQTEGSTTVGLASDTDYVFCLGKVKAVHNLTKDNNELEIIQSPNPGYCFLRDNFRLFKKYHKYDKHRKHRGKRGKRGKPFLKNTFQIYDNWFGETPEMEGPAIIHKTLNGDFINCVWAFLCISWPDEIREAFILSQRSRTWPNKVLTDQVLESLCFVVPKGSEVGETSDIEWRISFSCGERLLMFDLNTVQMRCYIVMKYIKSTFLDTIDGCKGVVSSYICKTALFHVISKSQKNVWIEEELLTNLNQCLRMLRKFIDEKNCPHFIMPTNNLFASRLDSEIQRRLLSTELDRIMASQGRALFDVDIDNFGALLKTDQELTRNLEWETCIQGNLIYNIINQLTASWLKANYSLYEWHAWPMFGVTEIRLKSEILELAKLGLNIDATDQRMADAVKMVMCKKSTMMGSCLASDDFHQNRGLSHKAFQWLLLGLQCSDAASSYLKFASILFSDKDMYCAEVVLNDVSKKLVKEEMDSFCICQRMGIHSRTPHCILAFLSKKAFVNILRENVGFCVTFLPCEINCCPKELQFEMFRTAFCDRNALPTGHSTFTNWIYYAVLPPEPLLYFLQYKLYKQQCMLTESLESLLKLENIAVGEKLANLHRETIWNLVAQCMEQEENATAALRSYKRSLIRQPNCNAARVLLCCFLNKQFKLRNRSRE